MPSPVPGGSHAVGAGWHGHPEAKARREAAAHLVSPEACCH